MWCETALDLDNAHGRLVVRYLVTSGDPSVGLYGPSIDDLQIFAPGPHRVLATEGWVLPYTDITDFHSQGELDHIVDILYDHHDDQREG